MSDQNVQVGLLVLYGLLDEIVTENLTELHYLGKCNEYSLESLYNTNQIVLPPPKQNHQLTSKKKQSNQKNINSEFKSENSEYSLWSSSSSPQIAQCPVCKDNITASRFSSHLDKCQKKILTKKR